MSTINRLGIDLSADHFALCLVGPDGQPLAPARRFPHNWPGSRAALDYVLQACATQPAEQLAIGGEATGLLWWHLFHQWAADPELAELHPVFSLLDPAQVHGFRQVMPPHDKIDRLEPQLIARYLGVPEVLPAPWTSHLETWPLRFPWPGQDRLTRFRCRLAHVLASLKSYAYTWIYLKASSYVELKPFGDTFGKASLKILRRYPTLDTLATMPVEELAAQIDALGKHRFADPLDNARKLQEVARTSYPLDPAVAEAVHFILGQTLDIIRFLDHHLAATNAVIAYQVQDDATNLLHNFGYTPLGDMDYPPQKIPGRIKLPQVRLWWRTERPAIVPTMTSTGDLEPRSICKGPGTTLGGDADRLVFCNGRPGATIIAYTT